MKQLYKKYNSFLGLRLRKKYNTELLPVDSEHFSIMEQTKNINNKTILMKVEFKRKHNDDNNKIIIEVINLLTKLL